MKKLKARFKNENFEIPPIYVEEILTKMLSRQLDLEITMSLYEHGDMDKELMKEHRERLEKQIKTLNDRDFLGGTSNIHS